MKNGAALAVPFFSYEPNLLSGWIVYIGEIDFNLLERR